jgi:hypothetical protein
LQAGLFCAPPCCAPPSAQVTPTVTLNKKGGKEEKNSRPAAMLLNLQLAVAWACAEPYSALSRALIEPLVEP